MDAAQAAVQRIDELGLTDLERRIVALKADGYTHDEIAAHLGLASGKAVESRVGRCRERLLAS